MADYASDAQPIEHIVFYTAVYIPEVQLLLFGGAYYNSENNAQRAILFGGAFPGLEESLPEDGNIRAFKSQFATFYQNAKMIHFAPSGIKATPAANEDKIKIPPDLYDHRIYGLHYVNKLFVGMIRIANKNYLIRCDTINTADITKFTWQYSSPSLTGNPASTHCFVCIPGAMVDNVWHDNLVTVALLLENYNVSTDWFTNSIWYAVLGTPLEALPNGLSARNSNTVYVYQQDARPHYIATCRDIVTNRFHLIVRLIKNGARSQLRHLKFSFFTTQIPQHNYNDFSNGACNFTQYPVVSTHCTDNFLFSLSLITDLKDNIEKNTIIDLPFSLIEISTLYVHNDAIVNYSWAFSYNAYRNLCKTKKIAEGLHQIQPGVPYTLLPICPKDIFNDEGYNLNYTPDYFGYFIAPTICDTFQSQPRLYRSIKKYTEAPIIFPPTDFSITEYGIPLGRITPNNTTVSYSVDEITFNKTSLLPPKPDNRYFLMDSLPIKQKDGNYKFIYYGGSEIVPYDRDGNSMWRPLLGLLYCYTYSTPTDSIVTTTLGQYNNQIIDWLNEDDIHNPGLDVGSNVNRSIKKSDTGKLMDMKIEVNPSTSGYDIMSKQVNHLESR